MLSCTGRLNINTYTYKNKNLKNRKLKRKRKQKRKRGSLREGREAPPRRCPHPFRFCFRFRLNFQFFKFFFLYVYVLISNCPVGSWGCDPRDGRNRCLGLQIRIHFDLQMPRNSSSMRCAYHEINSAFHYWAIEY